MAILTPALNQLGHLWAFMPSLGFVENWRKTRAGLDDLARIVRVEIDVVRSYDRAIKKVGHPGTADQLAQFRNEHSQHLVDLFASRRLASRFPKRLREEGKLRHAGFEGSVGLADDTESALREVLAVEEVCSRGWFALAATLPPGLGPIVERIREDERRHLRFLKKLIETRVWELEESVPETP
jgi:hypothetical protein